MKSGLRGGSRRGCSGAGKCRVQCCICVGGCGGVTLPMLAVMPPLLMLPLMLMLLLLPAPPLLLLLTLLPPLMLMLMPLALMPPILKLL